MKYTVVWLRTALKKLATIWNAGPDRAAITDASNRIDRILLHDASSQGEGRGGDMRILICPPLAVYFKVSEDDRLVSVYDVWRVTS